MNNISAIGRIGQAPDVRFFESGAVLANFSVALSNGKKGEEKPPTWLPCKAWGTTAELIANYCLKGHKIGISGRISSESWIDSAQKRKSKLIVIVERVDLLEPKSNNDDQPAAA